MLLKGLIFLVLLFYFFGVEANKVIAEVIVTNKIATELPSKPDQIMAKENSVPKLNDRSFVPYVIENNKFVSQTVDANELKLSNNAGTETPQIIIRNNNKILKIEISESTNYYDEINLELPDYKTNDLDELSYNFSHKDPCKEVSPLIYKDKEVSPFVNRLKTVYFLTSLSTGIGQGRKIQDSFTKGKALDGGGTSLGEYYGYSNVARNLMNPIGRAIKGAEADDSGNFVNFTLHPLFGFGIASYLTTSGASTKEALLVTLADNFIFEYIVEGTYVAPSGIDLLATSGGCIAGYLVSKYILKKPFKAFVRGSSFLKQKYNLKFDPIIEPGYVGKGMRVGSQVTFWHK